MANSSILLDNDEKTEIPAAVRLAQQQGFLSMEQQPVVPVAKLFFSFDIVNSTVYKANTVNWPIIIKGLLDYIRRCVQREADLQGASLWRVIGDEMVFVYQIIDKRELYPAVDAIFRITQRVSLSIRTGKFFNTFDCEMPVCFCCGRDAERFITSIQHRIGYLFCGKCFGCVLYL